MKIVSWNVNSLRNAESKFMEFLQNYTPDIVMIQELRAHPDQLSFFLKLIPGYGCFFNDSGKPGYSGTALYYKDTLILKDRSKEVAGYERLKEEGRFITFELNGVRYINVYTPNGSDMDSRLGYKLEYYRELIKYVKSLRTQKIPVVLGGDLNIAHTQKDVYTNAYENRSGCLQVERELFSELLDIGLIDTFRMFNQEKGFYSWWNLQDKTRSENKGWRFDYILISSDLVSKVKSGSILKEVFGSDHCPVVLEME